MSALHAVRPIAFALLSTTALCAGGPLHAKTPKRAAPLEARCYDVAVRDGLAVLGQTGGIVTIDVSDPVHPRELGRMGVNATVRAVTLDGDRAWLAAGAYGLVSVDLGDPADPRLEHRIDVPGKVVEAVPLAGRVLLAESRHGLSVMDLTIPDRPRRTASVATRDEVRALALRDRLLATAEKLAGVRLFDVTHPDTPSELATIDRLVEGARDLAFVENLLLVATGRGGLVLIDVSRPREPRVTAELPPERSALTVTPYGRLALVGNGSAGVQIVDPFPPEAPRTLGVATLSSRMPAGRLAVEGDVVYVAADLGGWAMIDLQNVAEPLVLHPRSRRMRVTMP